MLSMTINVFFTVPCFYRGISEKADESLISSSAASTADITLGPLLLIVTGTIVLFVVFHIDIIVTFIIVPCIVIGDIIIGRIIVINGIIIC